MKYKCFIAAFLLLCLVPSLGLAVFGPARAAANESQAAFPGLRLTDGRWNTRVLAELGDWFGDRFALRQELITVHSALTAAALGESAAPEVVLGKDGWLFYADTLADYTGSDKMTERELWAAARTLALAAEYCRTQNVRFLFTIAPNKNALYGEQMPARYPRDPEASDGERLLAQLAAQGVDGIDLFAAFQAQPAPLYRRLDSHWTQRGAALAADALLSAVAREAGWFSQDYAEVDNETGDLYAMLYPAGTKKDRDEVFAGAFSFTYPRPIRSPEDHTIRTETPDQTGSLLMFRDSFGNALYPLLAERFGRACFSRATPYDLWLLEREQADTLVIELVQRNLRWLLARSLRFPAPIREPMAAADTAGEARVSAAPSQYGEGYVEVSGDLDCQGLDTDSPVYLQCGETLYEALPTGERSFLASLPEGEGGQIRAVLVYCGGKPTRLVIKPEE